MPLMSGSGGVQAGAALVKAIREGLPAGVELDEREEALLDLAARQADDVKAYMGHADIQTTMIYAHHVPRHDAADRLTELLRAQSEDADRRTVDARGEDGEEAEGAENPLRCRGFGVPEEGLEPPTRGL
jgi:hypothetical protein